MKVKMLHVCIRIMDLEESMKFYRDAIGLRETRRKDFPDYGFTLVYLSDHEGLYELELTYNYDQEESYVIGDGYSHLAVSAEDIEAMRERHLEMGYEVTELSGLPGTRPSYYFVTDPDGYRVEIIRADSHED